MDTNPDDLSELERRLSAWEPAGDGLSSDAMLFAAGRAAARSGPARFVWPALAGFMTVLAVVLGAWLRTERSERLLLVQALNQQSPAPAPPSPAPVVAPSGPPTADEPGQYSFLSAHRALHQGLDDWPPSADRPEPPGPPGPERPVLRVGDRGSLLVP
jgi:hypothetical protein